MAWRAQVEATHLDVNFLSSTQEEADTKIVWHAISAKERGATRLLTVAQHTDILVLAIWRYPRIPEDTFFVPQSDNHI